MMPRGTQVSDTMATKLERRLTILLFGSKGKGARGLKDSHAHTAVPEAVLRGK
uniref:Uncharacterized protein n=1 Tax=Nelumbo nucifera TaxID=4432 RepID=A0A822YN90_NELNU|nr:TPA_asm: hypothetical protein HUJ06_011630 [Nelumbo nucifera]